MSNIIQTFPKGSGGGHVVLDTNGTAVDQEKKLQFTGLDVSDDSTNEKTEVKAIGLNADSLDDIIQSASVQGNAVASNGLVYSTTEQIVGRWIDGKPIYQKVIDFGYGPSTNSEKAVPHNITNIDKWISIKAVANYSNKNGWELNTASTTIAVRLLMDATNARIVSNNEGHQTVYYYVFLQYTKTTDT